MKEIYENIYLKELDLPNNPLKYLNFYIIKGKEKSMIIDTGFNREDIKAEIHKVMDKMELTPQNTVLFLTHLHSDHTGLAGYLQSLGMKIYASKIDADLLNESLTINDYVWVNTIKRAKLQGLEVDGLKIEDHPGFKYRPTDKLDYIEAVPGENIKIGDYNFEIIDLKGHTPGIIGLYEKDHKILFCGDHILSKITPNITFWGFQYGDSLGDYFKSLDKVYDMDIEHLYSSHRPLLEDHRARIDELKNHHRKRLEEVRTALKKCSKSTVRNVTKQMHWDISSRNWDEFPKAQKWFAAGEAHAHLEHLRAIGEVTVEEIEGVLSYSLVE